MTLYAFLDYSHWFVIPLSFMLGQKVLYAVIFIACTLIFGCSDTNLIRSPGIKQISENQRRITIEGPADSNWSSITIYYGKSSSAKDVEGIFDRIKNNNVNCRFAQIDYYQKSGKVTKCIYESPHECSQVYSKLRELVHVKNETLSDVYFLPIFSGK